MKILLTRAARFVIAFVFLFTLLPFKAIVTTASAADYTLGDSFIFGSYPQDKVTDSTLIAALNLCTPDAGNNVTYSGAKYKLVNFSQYTPYYSTLAPSAGSSYQDDNGYYTDTAYWFEYKPIQWRVLANNSGTVFVMAEKILDARAYNQLYTPVTWETSTLRSWLNNEFYNAAFSSAEKLQIQTSSVVNDDHPIYGTEGGNNTSDKVFLLSYNEAINSAYNFNPGCTKADPARIAQGTDYSKCGGLYVYASDPCTGNSGWWFRSPGTNSKNASHGNGYGHIYDFYPDNKAYVGVRPVMNLNLDMTLIKPVDGSGCVIESENKVIYGLETGLTKTQFESNYIILNSIARPVYSTESNTLGTGTKVDLVDIATGDVLETFTLVIFGDVNGDGNIDAADADICVEVQNWRVNWSHDTQGYNYLAGDVNGDGNIDSIDSDIMTEVSNWRMNINQITGLAAQS